MNGGSNKLVGVAMMVAVLGVGAVFLAQEGTPGLTDITEVSSQLPDYGLEITVDGEAEGTIVIDLLEGVAPNHVERIVTLAQEGSYDDVIFHRVIDGFMAQTGDVQFGKVGGDKRMAGRGGSSYSDLLQEFSEVPFERGTVGMARGGHSVDSANSQFFIMFDQGYFLNGQYTVVGQVTSGMDVVDAIKRGHPRSGAVDGDPDRMVSVKVTQN
ncbi:MAG: peptidylprolyl isomerase [Cognatishimia activa]